MGKYGFSVFVGNLSRRVRRDDLKDTFRDMGRIIEVDIKTGYAFIEFEERRDAEDACKELNGIKMEGERISVEMSKGCRDKYRDFARTGRIRYRSFSKEVSPSRRRHRSRSRGGRSRSRDRRSRSRGGGGGRGGNERPYRTRHSLTVENLSSRCR
jgi:arginine/serine-rich splicing factor 4/5/6